MGDLLINTTNTATVITYIATDSNPDCCPEMSDIIFFSTSEQWDEHRKYKNTDNVEYKTKQKMFKFVLT